MSKLAARLATAKSAAAASPQPPAQSTQRREVAPGEAWVSNYLNSIAPSLPDLQELLRQADLYIVERAIGSATTGQFWHPLLGRAIEGLEHEGIPIRLIPPGWTWRWHVLPWAKALCGEGSEQPLNLGALTKEQEQVALYLAWYWVGGWRETLLPTERPSLDVPPPDRPKYAPRPSALDGLDFTPPQPRSAREIAVGARVGFVSGLDKKGWQKTQGGPVLSIDEDAGTCVVISSTSGRKTLRLDEVWLAHDERIVANPELKTLCDRLGIRAPESRSERNERGWGVGLGGAGGADEEETEEDSSYLEPIDD